MARREEPPKRIAVQNRKARFDYHILETVEAGVVLTGSELKSLRAGHGSLVDSYAQDVGNELYLYNVHIPQYASARENHEPNRVRKLLLHRKEIDRLVGAITRRGMTIVPLSIYFNQRGRAKVQLGLGQGKKLHDKRATTKDREWKREQGRLLRQSTKE